MTNSVVLWTLDYRINIMFHDPTLNLGEQVSPLPILSLTLDLNQIYDHSLATFP